MNPRPASLASIFVQVAGAVACVCVAALALVEPDYHLQTCLAALNVGVGTCLIVAIWRRHGRPATPSVAFLPGFAVSWPLTSLYFAFFNPDGVFFTMDHEVRFLDNGTLIQVCVLVFFMGYASTFLWLAPRQPTPAPLSDGPTSDTLEWGLVLLALLSTTSGWLAPAVHGGSLALFIGNGLRNYFSAFMLIAGYRWTQWARVRRVVIVVVMTMAAVMYTLANARGLALWALMLLMVGYFISPHSSRRWKRSLVLMAIVLVPIYSVVGNQTRASNLGVGYNNMDDRAQVLSTAIQTGEFKYDSTGFVSDFLGRLYSCGGAILIGVSDEDPSQFEFDLQEFVSDAFLSLVPGFLGGRSVDARYASSAMLSNYFVISDSTSVEVSLVGSLFTYSGLVSVFMGSALLGALHAGVSWLIVRRKKASAWQLTLISCLTAINLVNYNLDWVGNVRSLVWGILYAVGALAVVQLADRLLRAEPWAGRALNP